MPEYSCRPCRCGSGEYHYPLLDARGIFCDYVCEQCEATARKKYRPDTFSGYDQSDRDEPIEPEPDAGPAGGEWWR